MLYGSSSQSRVIHGESLSRGVKQVLDERKLSMK